MSDSQPPPPLPSELPVLPLRQTVVFPLTIAPLSVGRPLSVDSINRALSGNRMLLLLLQETEAADPRPPARRSLPRGHGRRHPPDGQDPDGDEHPGGRPDARPRPQHLADRSGAAGRRGAVPQPDRGAAR